MKKSFKCLLAGLVLITANVCAFADAPALKADSGKVIIVGKINVVYDESRDFIFKTRGLPETAADKADTYVVPYVMDSSDTFGSNSSKYYKENQTEYPIGDTFIVQVKRNKKAPNTLTFKRNFPMYFFDNGRATIYLPLPLTSNTAALEVDVPDDVDAIYLGTFNYYVTGDNFTIDNFERIDEYDVAQEELDRRLGTHCDMARAVIKVVDYAKDNDDNVDAK